ncbi:MULTISPECIES: hypothetical protein [Cyanophyceae]|uniref:hypothetical protein n=1 Tax=Cyanophyceae TaxID=3028117 RepID=UPI001A7E3CC5|nr:hypothetical protein [Phormidium sp. FACHB-592]
MQRFVTPSPVCLVIAASMLTNVDMQSSRSLAQPMKQICCLFHFYRNAPSVAALAIAFFGFPTFPR